MSPRPIARLSLAEAVRLHAQNQARRRRSEPFPPPRVPPLSEIRAPRFNRSRRSSRPGGYRGVK